MHRYILLVCLCAVLAIPASANDPSWTNLLSNGNFANNLNHWSKSGAVVWDHNNGSPAGSALVEGTKWALLTQTVEAYWNPDMSRTEYQLKAKVKILPVEDIHLKIGYWLDDTTAPTLGATPDVTLDLISITDTDECWKTYTLHGFLDCQPRWFSVRIEWNPYLNPHADCHGWVDQVSFKARCVPEPSCLVTLLGATVGLAWRRIKRAR